MKLLREVLDYKNIKTIYSTLFESLITYEIISWDRAYDSNL